MQTSATSFFVCRLMNWVQTMQQRHTHMYREITYIVNFLVEQWEWLWSVWKGVIEGSAMAE
jgi:hypothetical protein